MDSLVRLPTSALRFARERTADLIRDTDSHIRKWRAIYARRRSSATYIAVTGSSAKSTATGLIVHILSGVAPVRARVSANLLNAYLGALQKPPPDRGYFVGEIGAEGPGTLKPMLDLIRPTVGVVTLVRLEHKSVFRSIEAVMQEKGRLVEALPANGLAILNGDDPRVASMAERTKARVVTFGQTGGDYLVRNVTCEAPESLALTIEHRGQTFELTTRLTGMQHAVAVAAAFSCTHQLGVSPQVIVERIASFQPLYGRCSVHRVEHGPVFIIDTVKAPYHSLQLALDTVAKFPAPRKRIVLGHISDVAGSNEKYPRAYRAARAIADQVIFIGEHSHRSKASAEDISSGRFVRFATAKEAAAFLRESAMPGEIIFLKSAINLHLERLVLDFFTSVHCWKDACGKKVTCARLSEGGCGLYEVPFEQHRAARKEGPRRSPAIHLG
jgi:UDP-N-acetylmuramoyl-tripeptide--D-alanyl-D-alanine ligase